jgi:hypothetical protein
MSLTSMCDRMTIKDYRIMHFLLRKGPNLCEVALAASLQCLLAYSSQPLRMYLTALSLTRCAYSKRVSAQYMKS